MAIRIDRVYTRSGDAGETSLVGGARVSKGSLKLEAYGTVDELNTLVGLARTWIASDLGGLPAEDRPALDGLLRRIQNELFDLGSLLATPAGRTYAGMPAIAAGQVAALEREMDALQAGLEPLRSFTLPGGNFANAALHQCRAVCRRCERVLVRLSAEEEVAPEALKYLNRLGDLFFVLSRHASRRAGAAEYLWERGTGGEPRPG